jgi:hypothetical protein
MEQEVKEVACNAANAICDVLRYFGDMSYAVLPREIAHDLGDLNKKFWSGVRCVVDKEIDWIDERVAGGDKMREEWQQRCQTEAASEASGPVS